MSVRSEATATATGTQNMTDLSAALAEATPAEAHLGEGQSYSVNTPENPLRRQVVVSVRASLNDLCLQKSKGTWSPSPEALKSIFQQKRFTSLDGSAEHMGDLKSMVLHDMSVTHVKSTFPMALGAKISGVDDSTFSSTGEAFSTIVLPHTDQAVNKKLQADDVSLGALCFTCCCTFLVGLVPCFVSCFRILTTLFCAYHCSQPTSSARNFRA